ncbi:MAG: hypothetical protein U9R10_01995 [Euryarchaeota archaeon]|nr:hypothetical protein [Euryarchaeota archaeon]
MENLLIAAEHFGYAHQVTYLSEPGNEELAAVVQFTPREQTPAFRPTALFEAIPARHTNRQAYQARPIQPEDLQRLHDCCVKEGIQLHVTDDLSARHPQKYICSQAIIRHGIRRDGEIRKAKNSSCG